MGERRGRQTPSDTTTTSSTCPVAHRVSPKAVLGAKLCPDAVGDGEEVRGGREDEVDDGLGAEEEDGAAAKAFFTLSFFLVSRLSSWQQKQLPVHSGRRSHSLTLS